MGIPTPLPPLPTHRFNALLFYLQQRAAPAENLQELVVRGPPHREDGEQGRAGEEGADRGHLGGGGEGRLLAGGAA